MRRSRAYKEDRMQLTFENSSRIKGTVESYVHLLTDISRRLKAIEEFLKLKDDCFFDESVVELPPIGKNNG